MGLLHSLKEMLTPSPDLGLDLGRNDRCWCGSGKKYKTCHLSADERKRAANRSPIGRPAGRGF